MTNLLNLKVLSVTSFDSTGFETCLSRLTGLNHLGLIFTGALSGFGNTVFMPSLPRSLTSLFASGYQYPSDFSFLQECPKIVHVALN